MGALSRPDEFQDAPVPFVGWSLLCLVGELEEEQQDYEFLDDIELPETYDTFLQTLSYVSPSDAKPLEIAWTKYVFTDSEYSSNMV